jgi:hypothetical protein
MSKHIETRFRFGDLDRVLECVSDDAQRRTLLYASDDGFATTHDVQTPAPVFDAAIRGPRWSVLTGTHVHETTTAGATWSSLALPVQRPCRVMEVAGHALWIASGREILVVDDRGVTIEWRLPDPSSGGPDEAIARLYPLAGGDGFACTDRMQVYRVTKGSSTLEGWSDGLSAPSRGAYELSNLGGIWFTGSHLRRLADPTWHPITAGVPAWAAHVTSLVTVEYSTWIAAPWATDVWIGRDPMRVLEARAGGAVRELWRRPDTWTMFKAEPRAGDDIVVIGLLRATPTLGGIAVRDGRIDVLPLPPRAFDLF